jgi:hypothetical protein
VYIQGWLSEQFSGSQAAFGTTFRVTGEYWKAGTSSIQRVTGGFSKFVSDFIEASKSFSRFLHKRQNL